MKIINKIIDIFSDIKRKTNSNYSKKDFYFDLVSGFTGAIIVIPQAIAFAIIAGLPPEYGLFTAIFPVIISAILGSSLLLVSGPTTALSTLTISSLQGIHIPGSQEYISLVITLTALVGIIQLSIGVLKWGKILEYITQPILLGFTYCSAIIIIISQIKSILGINIHISANSFENIYQILKHASDINIYNLMIGCITIFSAIYSKQVHKNFPNYLFGMLVGGIIGNILFSGDIKFISAIQTGFPTLSIPEFSLYKIITLLPYAFIIALMGLIASISLGKQSSKGGKYDINTECIGQGLGNFIGSFCNSYLSSGSVTRTAINISSGAKSKLSSVFAGLILFIILINFYHIINYLPLATISGITILVGIGLLDFGKIKKELKHKKEMYVFFSTVFVGLFVKLEFSIIIGIITQLLLNKYFLDDNSSNESL